MRTWKLRPGDPLNLILAADSRFTDLNYVDDQIWELLPGTGEPGAVLLQTTYGLRARSMRLFPQFSESHQEITDPAEFDKPLTITHFAPNFLRMVCSPLPEIEAQMEVWVSDSHTIAGRILIRNNSELDRKVRLNLAAVLTPSTEGRPMVPRKKEGTNVLQGLTEDLSPILFITGGAQATASPYPNLYHELELAPEAFRRFTWVLASLPDDDDSFRHARLTAAQNWDAEVSKIEMRTAQMAEVETGNPDWDAAFAFGQKAAYSLLYSPSEKLPNHSFVSTRLPDQGYSQQGKGTEYNHLWSGQTPLEAWYLNQYLLPDGVRYAKGLLRNFIAQQNENGFIDHKPGLAGQHSNLLAMPLLIDLAWQIYQTEQDKTFLNEVFRPLLWYIQAWFWETNDRDGDGIPEWSNLLQTGYDDNPLFSRWEAWSQGTDITLVESPDLCAYLYREIQTLLKIADEIGQQEPVAYLQALADNLHRAVQTAWNGNRGTYQYWDREIHESQKGELLKERTGPGEMLVDMVFETPPRLQIRLEAADLPTSKVEMTIHGSLPNGQHKVDRITPDQLTWHAGMCTYTLPDLYGEIEHLHIQGLPAEGTAALWITDLYQDDHTLLVPLWAGIPDQKQVKRMIKRRLHKDTFYHHPYGIPAVPKPASKEAAAQGLLAWLPWNVMVGEGLLAYGKQAEATELVTRLMDGIAQNLKRESAFRAYYHVDEAHASGQRNHLIGLPPLGLFLKTLGVRLFTPWKVEITGTNPFPESVTIKYRGMTIISNQEAVEIHFPDGETVTVDGDIPCMVEHDPMQLPQDSKH